MRGDICQTRHAAVDRPGAGILHACTVEATMPRLLFHAPGECGFGLHGGAPKEKVQGAQTENKETTRHSSRGAMSG